MILIEIFLALFFVESDVHPCRSRNQMDPPTRPCSQHRRANGSDRRDRF